MYAMQRKAIESLYVGVCNVIEHQSVKNPITQIMEDKEVTVLVDQPCKLSFERVTSANQTSAAAIVTQYTKLIIAPEIEIKPGSKIIVTQRGRVETYTRSGQPAFFTSHQEIQLELFVKWA